MKKTVSAYRTHLVFFLVYAPCSFALFWLGSKDTGYSFGLSVMMVWNCFLSFLPRIFARQSVSSRENRKRIWQVWALLWLIFWPNTFYMATDVAHFTGNSFYTEIPYQSPVYSSDLLLWAKGLLIVSGILYGVLNGVRSEAVFEAGIIRPYGKKKAIAFRAGVSFLGGVGIYLGRFLRLNSWDVLRPVKIADAFWNAGHGWGFAAGFAGLCTVFLFTALSLAGPLAAEKPEQL